MDGDGVDTRAVEALTVLRGEIVPETVGRLTGAEVGVTGPTAQAKDGNDQVARAAPLVLAFVLTLALALVLLLVTFRSIVVAVKAVLLNLLSVGAAYGVLVLVFQHGWGKELIGLDAAPGGVVGFLPVFLFVILFGLSMDYHVFILSRVREAVDRGVPTRQAVRHGVETTAGVVTSAALVMVGVFAIFASLPFVFLKEFGVGLAVAILLDATVVRAVLLPATMTLLGERNWYLPRLLDRRRVRLSTRS
jgi:RND superfamily putative drug exporter